MLTKASYSQDGSDTNSVGTPIKSRDHRMHMYSDPRDQCSLNTQKLNNKSYIHTYRLTQIMTIMAKSYIDKASRAE